MDQWGSLQTPDQIFTLFSSEPTASALSVKEFRMKHTSDVSARVFPDVEDCGIRNGVTL